MSIKVFTEEEIEILKRNPNVKKVTSKSITYTLEFKLDFMHEYNGGKLPRQIFIEHGFDIDLIGMKRVDQSACRWKRDYNAGGVVALDDSRKNNRGRYKQEKQTQEDIIEEMKAKIALIEAENEMLKKLDASERRNGTELRKSKKFELINYVIDKHNLRNMVVYLCKIFGVSKSGYYSYFNQKSINNRKRANLKDHERYLNIKMVFERGKKKIGIEQVKMQLKNDFDINYNKKSISRIMNKYELHCKIRKTNPYKKMIKATSEHRVHNNHLNRNFNQNTPYKVLLTDITYLKYNGKISYLSAILDGSTKQIVAYKVSKNLKIDFVLDTIDQLNGIKLPDGVLIHSDQGAHYTSPKFSKKVAKMGILQSMSRRGNCWDNAPMESFFGHMKDYIDQDDCHSFDDLVTEINEYMYYYNHKRYQWKLNKLAPIQYRDQLEVA